MNKTDLLHMFKFFTIVIALLSLQFTLLMGIYFGILPITQEPYILVYAAPTIGILYLAGVNVAGVRRELRNIQFKEVV